MRKTLTKEHQWQLVSKDISTLLASVTEEGQIEEEEEKEEEMDSDEEFFGNI